MDLLFSKYASPFIFIDQMILNGTLCEMIDEIWKIEDDKKLWDFYLHKVHDKSFDEFVNSIRGNHESKSEPEQLETTVKESYSILAGFIPTERGE
jgi:hypothetical protein